MAAWVRCRGGCEVFLRVSPPESYDVWCEACVGPRQGRLAEAVIEDFELHLRGVVEEVEDLSPHELLHVIQQWWPEVFTEAFQRRIVAALVDVYAENGEWER